MFSYISLKITKRSRRFIGKPTSFFSTIALHPILFLRSRYIYLHTIARFQKSICIEGKRRMEEHRWGRDTTKRNPTGVFVRDRATSTAEDCLTETAKGQPRMYYR